MTTKKRVELYQRLPEIYRIKDEDLPEKYLESEAFQLKSFLAPVEDMFSAIHENIESLYHDLFIETCDEWVIPYIADLLGTSHLSGDPWTVRADVASTIALRRRKGTLGAIELLAYILTKWGVHCVELRENLVWNQHLNHQRPDEGGEPPYSLPKIKRQTPIRGGTMNLRDPSIVALLDTPFDPFAHVADARPHKIGQVRYNLPNLAIYLWRLKDYRLRVVKPFCRKITQAPGEPFIVRVNVNPVPRNRLSAPYVKPANRPGGQPVTLFNTNRLGLFDESREGTDKLNLSAIAPRISGIDEVPAPIPVERVGDAAIAEEYDDFLASTSEFSFEDLAESRMVAPHKYVSIETYNQASALLATLDISDVGFQLHLPQNQFAGKDWLHEVLPRNWTIRGANLCAWERGLQPVLNEWEIAIDPERGRVCIAVPEDAQANALVRHLLLTFTYGAVGEVGAHPISYPSLPPELDVTKTPTVDHQTVSLRANPDGLRDALVGISTKEVPTVIEIVDSFTHFLDLNDGALSGDVENEGGVVSLKLNAPLIIRAADNERPIVKLARPLAFRPTNVTGADDEEQNEFDAVMNELFVRLEGLFVARDRNFASYLPVAQRKDEPLIARAALNRLEILSCTLDPGGFVRFDGTRAPLFPALRLFEPYGFADADDEREFKQTPDIVIQRSICGAIFTDEGYRLCLIDSIVDAGQGVGDSGAKNAISGATDSLTGYAGATVIRNATIFGRTRAASIEGSGGIFVHALEVENQQIGCLKFSYFADEANILPQNHACVSGKTAKLFFTSEFFGAAAYAQLSLECDRRILEEGANNDQMGAFNFLLEAHKWRNLQIRFREFMPVGVRPLLIPVT